MTQPMADLTCTTCGTSFQRTGTRGPFPKFCLDCRAEKQRAAVRASASKRRAADPEADRQKQRDWRRENPEKARAQERRKYAAHRDEILAQNKRWREANLERSRELARLGHQRRKADDPEGFRAKRNDQVSLRRARQAAATVEKFTSREIYERDGWVCQLCNTPVDRSAIFPDRRAPSLDHIVALSRGGAHSRANTQLACLGCNIQKGNRPWPTTSSLATPQTSSEPPA